MKGFTLIELILVLAILAIVSVLSIPFIQIFQTSSDLYTYTDSIAQTLRRANQQSVAGQDGSAWGVYFDTAGSRLVMFKGNDYAGRDDEYDQEIDYPDSFVVSADFGDEISFSLYRGLPSDTGTIIIASVESDVNKYIVISEIGLVKISDKPASSLPPASPTLP